MATTLTIGEPARRTGLPVSAIPCDEPRAKAVAGCICCGCLSVDGCSLYNDGDVADRLGPGSQYILPVLPAGQTSTAK
jgi:hypothetical protein